MSHTEARPSPHADAAEVAELATSLGLLDAGLQRIGSIDDVRAWLITAITPSIDRMLRHDRARLGQVLYRIDVDEGRVEDVVRSSPVDEVGSRVASLVVDRVIERIANRRRLEQLLRDG